MGTESRKQTSSNKGNNEVHEVHYKGTFIAVMLLGVLMVATWFEFTHCFYQDNIIS